MGKYKSQYWVSILTMYTPNVPLIIGVLGIVSNDLEKHLDRISIPKVFLVQKDSSTGASVHLRRVFGIS